MPQVTPQVTRHSAAGPASPGSDRHARAERRLAFWRSVCGCQMAAWALLLTLGWQALQVTAWLPLDGWAVCRALGWALLAAIGAKLATLALARLAIVVEVQWIGPASEPGPGCANNVERGAT